MSARWWTFLVWAGVAASAAAWSLKIFVQPLPTPPQAMVATAGPVVRGDLTRLLGNDPPPALVAAATQPVADARFQLIGVVSPRSAQAAREGLALIAVDGKQPRAYRVGAVVDGPHVLQSVETRGATLGPRDGAAEIALKLPPPAAAATGVLPNLSPRGSSVLPRPLPQAQPAQAQPLPAQPVPVAPSVSPSEPEDGAESEPPPPTSGRAPLR